MRRLGFSLVGLTLAAACAGKAGRGGALGDTMGKVHFRDRTIDLHPFYEAFPYRELLPDAASGRLWYFHDEADRRVMRSVPLAGPFDLARGAEATPGIDWNGRSYGGAKFHPATQSMIVLGDERNDEVWNLYSVPVAGGAPERLTFVPYIYGYGLDAKKERVAYVARYGKQEPFKSCLRLLDPKTRKDDEIACDRPGQTFTWGDVVSSPDGAGALVTVQLDGQRQRTNLAWVSFADGAITLVTDPAKTRNVAFPLARWLDGHRFLYVSDESGFPQIYRHDTRTRATTTLSTFTEEFATDAGAHGAPMLTVGGKTWVAVAVQVPWETRLVLVDAEDEGPGRPVEIERTPAKVDIAEADGATLWTQQTALDDMISLHRVTVGAVDKGGGGPSQVALERAPVVELPPALRVASNRCRVERVEIPTFDGRKLHAFLLAPNDPPPEAERFAVVHTFYGGENVYDPMPHVICAAGGTWLSPAPRGSSGFGREFQALNDGDLGGDEIVDIVWAARWLARATGIPEARIGLWGRSHGGYATMRLLTFPEGVRGRSGREHREPFSWGFGMADAGFSNILTFYETCNIPDWVILEAGDPVAEKDKLIDRSPLSHVELLRAPLLLTHGENDNRVPVRESRQFAARARELGRPVTYVEFPGQGHRVKGLPGEARLWQVRFDFLQKVFAGPR